MSHHIFAVVVREEDVDPSERKYFKHAEKDGFLLISSSSALLHKVNLDIRRVQLMTDYFGGVGEQEASYFDENNVSTNFEDNTSGGAINSALAMLGVEPDGDKDRFDTIGLGRYRSDEDLQTHLFNEDIPENEPDDGPQFVNLPIEDYNEILGGLEDIANWTMITKEAHSKAGLPEPNIGIAECNDMQGIAKRLLKLARKGTIQGN